jgi:radical SAM superfamily enzyme YgiQ (UPF0313 family)
MQKIGKPKAVAITCAMTYWYPGVQEATGLVRDLWKDVPVLLGGAYATLCPDHAQKMCKPDLLLKGRDLDPALRFLRDRVGRAPEPQEAGPKSHDLVGARASAAVQASFGCPRKCPYCAAHMLGGPFRQRGVSEVLDEIAYLVHKKRRTHIAFYDDALLDGEGAFFLDLAEGLRSRNLHRFASFHCPNALNASAITDEAARALKASNFHTLRIGFETADPKLQKALGEKATCPDLEAAIDSLKSAGFHAKNLGVYLLAGLPGQEEEGVSESIRFVHKAGAQARLAEYAPVPGTPLFREAKTHSLLDLDEPTNHNKTLAAFRFSAFGLDGLKRLKDQTRMMNRALLL